MLKRIRIALAVLFFGAALLLFLDVTGLLQRWLGWGSHNVEKLVV